MDIKPIPSTRSVERVGTLSRVAVTRGVDAPRRGTRPGAVEAFVAVLLVAVLARGWLVGHNRSPPVQAWVIVFVALVIPAAPLLVLGAAISGPGPPLGTPAVLAPALPA